MTYFGEPEDIFERLADEIGGHDARFDPVDVRRARTFLSDELRRLAPVWSELVQYYRLGEQHPERVGLAHEQVIHDRA